MKQKTTNLPPVDQVLPSLTREQALLGAREFNPASRLTNYLRRFPRTFEALRICGIHPTIGVPIVDPYTQKTLHEDFSNIGYHTLAVASCAEHVAMALSQTGAISKPDIDWIVERSLMHDALKIFEICRFRAYHNGVRESGLFLQRNDANEILGSLNIPQDMRDYILGSGDETGGVNVGAMLEVTPRGISMRAGDLLKKIVRVADSITYTLAPNPEDCVPRSLFLTPWKRLVAAQSWQRYPLCLQHGFALSPTEGIVLVEDVKSIPLGCESLGHMLYLETLLGNWICAEILKTLDPSYSGAQPDEDFMRFVATMR